MNLRSVPIRLVVLDEVDSFPASGVMAYKFCQSLRRDGIYLVRQPAKPPVSEPQVKPAPTASRND